MRRFATANVNGNAAEPQPFAAMNITPLIDVLLVLLVMLILTIPIMANQVPMDLPAPGPAPSTERVSHALEITRGGATVLDGAVVGGEALSARLRGLADDPTALLVMRADPDARYDRFVETLAVVKRAGVTRLGFEGNNAPAE